VLEDRHHDSGESGICSFVDVDVASLFAAQGKMRCLGSNQHLKSKFGKGYVLQLKASANALLVALECVLRVFV
jgi:hypothetical protein